MRIAIFIRRGEYKFYNLGKDVLEHFKELYKAKQWRIVDIDEFDSKTDAIKYANEQIRKRILKLKYESGRKRTISNTGNQKDDKGAYRIQGSLKNYYGIRRKLDATKLIGTRVI